MFMLVSWFGLTLPLLNAADWFRLIRLLKRLFVSSHLSEVIYVWCYCWRYCFCSCWWRHVDRKSGSAGMPRPISYAVFCLKKKTDNCHFDSTDVGEEDLGTPDHRRRSRCFVIRYRPLLVDAR